MRGGSDMDLKGIQERLREVIKNSAYTQKYIAVSIGVSPQTVSK